MKEKKDKAVESTVRDPNERVRPHLRGLRGYVPGEQPKVKGLVKLNTNENPYPPSPKVIAALQAALDDRLRLYPNPASEVLREKLAKLNKCSPEQVLVGNGSDELLSLATRAFVGQARPGRVRAESMIQFFKPSYSLYPVLAAIHGATPNALPLASDFSFPSIAKLKRGKWRTDAALTFVTTPSAPTGRGYLTTELEVLCRAQTGVVVLDEAYADFAHENGLELALKYPHVLVMRTFSKAYSLCFLRVGYCVGDPALIAALDAIRDSYNVNGLGQAAAAATLDDLDYSRAHIRRIIDSRERLARDLAGFGFTVAPSQANFLWVIPPKQAAAQWLEQLRARKILVRWFDTPECKRHLRITIGTEEECAKLVQAVRSILRR